MISTNDLPPGQYVTDDFPLFGLSQYASRYNSEIKPLNIKIAGDVENILSVTAEDLAKLPHIHQTSDFHCVTTWTKQNLSWSGYRFRDFYEMIARPHSHPDENATFVIFRSHDGFRSILPLSDLLKDDVILADMLAGEMLPALHGGPLRLIAPAHYGYKSAKHIKAIEFWPDESKFEAPALRFMNHPRARVALEERGLWIPGWILRYVYRPLVNLTVRKFKRVSK